MVEANPPGPTEERISELQDQIFEPMDDKIRALFEWFKDLGMEIIERIEALARENRKLTRTYLSRVRQNRKEFADMFKK